MPIQIGICEDMEIEREMLKKKLVSFFIQKECDIELFQFSGGEELLDAEQKLDLVFLDIEMAGMGGISAGKQYHRRFPECKIVLVSGRLDKMREALVVEPFAFVDKPYEDAQLMWAVEEFLSTRIGYEKIVLFAQREETEVLQKDIKYAYAYESATEFVVMNQIMRKEISLNQLEKELDERMFFRVDRGNIVNLKYIENLVKNKFSIDDKRFTISVRRQKAFMDTFKKYRRMV